MIVHFYTTRSFSGKYIMALCGKLPLEREPFSAWGNGGKILNGTTTGDRITCTTCLDKYITKEKVKLDRLTNKLKDMVGIPE